MTQNPNPVARVDRDETVALPPSIAFVANSLIVPAIAGFRCPLPAHRTDDGFVTVWQHATIHVNDRNVPVSVELDLQTWYVTYASPSDTAGVTLPVVCHHQDTALLLADAFAAHVAQNYAHPHDPDALDDWCAWWVSENSGVELRARRRTDA